MTVALAVDQSAVDIEHYRPQAVSDYLAHHSSKSLSSTSVARVVGRGHARATLRRRCGTRPGKRLLGHLAERAEVTGARRAPGRSTRTHPARYGEPLLGAEIHFEPFLHLADLSAEDALIAWGGFWFHRESSDEGWHIVDDEELTEVTGEPRT